MEIDLGNSTIDYGKTQIIRDNNLPSLQANLEAPSADPGGPVPDSRIKSPDELLQQIAPNKAQLLTKELSEIKERHAKEIAQWKEYEQRVQDWRKQVIQILQNAKKDASDPTHQKLQTEIKALKSALHKKEEELKKLKELINTTLPQETGDDKRGFWAKLMAGK